MKKAIKLFIITSLFILFFHNSSRADHWERVVGKGFGDPANDYAWSMETFRGKVYVGTLNPIRGAEIWCSSSGEQGTWKRTYNARTPLANLGVRSLYTDGNQALYACTFNFSGAEILRTTDGQSWDKVKKSRGGENRKDDTIRCMIRFGNYLYGGGGGKGAQLYRSRNGSNWTMVKTNPSFESTKVPDPNTGDMVTNNILIGEMEIFKGQLYAFTWTRDMDMGNLIGQDIKDMAALIPNSPGAFEIWRSSDGTNWEKVVGKNDPYDNGMGFSLHDPENLANDVVTSVAVYKGKLYLGTQNDNGNSSIWRTEDGEEWEEVLDFFSLGEKFNFYVWRMIPFNDKLYIGTLNVALNYGNGSAAGGEATGAQVWATDSGDRGTFYNLVHNGFDGETISFKGKDIPKNYGIRSFAILEDTLFAGTATIASVPVPDDDDPGRRTIAGKNVGCEIWKLIQD
ncbi:MAG: hypothetical protein AB1611_08665 [bacterium]